jgi:hypothetical protein
VFSGLENCEKHIHKPVYHFDYKEEIENYALATGNEDLAEQNKVIKYWLRSFPVLSQGASILPMFYPNLAKDLGIKMQSNYGMR